MFKWIKEQLNYRAKYEALLDSKDEASKNALMVMGQYEYLCANLPYEHELSTKRHWEEHADARLLSEYEAQTRALNALRKTHRSMTELWQENMHKHGYVMYAEWQPIETAPRDDTEILVFCEDGGILIGCFAGGMWWIEQTFYEKRKPTHWMLLPNPPKE